jgi:hypothetical protein
MASAAPATSRIRSSVRHRAEQTHGLGTMHGDARNWALALICRSRRPKSGLWRGGRAGLNGSLRLLAVAVRHTDHPQHIVVTAMLFTHRLGSL